MILSFPNKSNYRKTMAFSIRFFCSNIYVMYRVLLFFHWVMGEKKTTGTSPHLGQSLLLDDRRACLDRRLLVAVIVIVLVVVLASSTFICRRRSGGGGCGQ